MPAARCEWRSNANYSSERHALLTQSNYLNALDWTCYLKRPRPATVVEGQEAGSTCDSGVLQFSCSNDCGVYNNSVSFYLLIAPCSNEILCSASKS